MSEGEELAPLPPPARALSSPDVTLLLQRVAQGDAGARNELLEVLYSDLRARAGRAMRGQPRGHTLQATALVHEAYLRLVGSAQTWNDRRHFLASATTAMRHVLVDHARARESLKRAPAGERVLLDRLVVDYEERAVDLVALDEALCAMEAFDPTMARAVELRFFGSASVDETARMVGLSTRTLERRLFAARAWLAARLR